MNIQKTIALVTAPLGMIFLIVDPSDLVNIITTTGLDWYRLFLPIAWGIIFGALAGILRLDFVQKALLPVIYVSTALFTFGVIGSLAIYFENRYWFLAMPTLWLAVAAVGLYAFVLTQMRFSKRYQESIKDKEQEK
ncbi:hypothetical protein ACR0ST_03850 [Aliidiomarina sp. Khilg15.8]